MARSPRCCSLFLLSILLLAGPAVTGGDHPVPVRQFDRVIDALETVQSATLAQTPDTRKGIKAQKKSGKTLSQMIEDLQDAKVEYETGQTAFVRQYESLKHRIQEFSKVPKPQRAKKLRNQLEELGVPFTNVDEAVEGVKEDIADAIDGMATLAELREGFEFNREPPGTKLKKAQDFIANSRLDPQFTPKKQWKFIKKALKLLKSQIEDLPESETLYDRTWVTTRVIVDPNPNTGIDLDGDGTEDNDLYDLGALPGRNTPTLVDGINRYLATKLAEPQTDGTLDAPIIELWAETAVDSEKWDTFVGLMHGIDPDTNQANNGTEGHPPFDVSATTGPKGHALIRGLAEATLHGQGDLLQGEFKVIHTSDRFPLLEFEAERGAPPFGIFGINTVDFSYGWIGVAIPIDAFAKLLANIVRADETLGALKIIQDNDKSPEDLEAYLTKFINPSLDLEGDDNVPDHVAVSLYYDANKCTVTTGK